MCESAPLPERVHGKLKERARAMRSELTLELEHYFDD